MTFSSSPVASATKSEWLDGWGVKMGSFNRKNLLKVMLDRDDSSSLAQKSRGGGSDRRRNTSAYLMVHNQDNTTRYVHVGTQDMFICEQCSTVH